MKITFWISLFIIFYTFIGYGILLYLIIRIKRAWKQAPVINSQTENLPTCTLLVAAYNEADFINEKISNTLALNYPQGKLSFLFVTDGSVDRTAEIISQYPEIRLMHSAERKGKIAAVHRAMETVKSEVVVFTDANTFLNADALIYICRHYADPLVGVVAGEKRLRVDETADATAGEGFYWKYESKLKEWDAELYSVVGAAGELFSIKTALYEPVEPDSILDDFMISMRVAEKGFRIVYEPQAYATESASENIAEELKRKIRIAAGGIQSVIRLKSLFNVLKFPVLSFQYISHRVLRWTITPFLLALVFILNGILAIDSGELFYTLLFAAQVAFYLLAISGWLLERRKLRVKALFIPYYFCVMNYAVIAGIIRYAYGKQSVIWDKAKRQS
ncbi:MAG: glycosyltransferase family 2 protein [Sphingobacteriaceae bacterium]